ncbi:MAG TPA: DUF6516 family protein [Rubrobacteraceae bacterium]|nr:DUF6516 family protein [Rubrobacteraceae bacterium]
MPQSSYGERIAAIRAILQQEAFQEKLRSKSVEIHPGEDGRGNFVIKTPGLTFVKPDDKPRGIVFRDHSFLVLYEKWSKKDNCILSYKYHYQRTDAENCFLRYDMEEWEQADHPKHHLQVSPLSKNIRLPTGEVHCEDVLMAIIAQKFVL